MSAGNILVVFGATGNVGSHVVEALLRVLANPSADTPSASDTTVRLVTRNPEALHMQLGTRSATLPPGLHVKVVQGDILCPESVSNVLEGAHRAFLSLPQCLSSQDMIKVSAAFTKACIAKGVTHIVRLSSAGIDARGEVKHMAQGSLGDAHVAGEKDAMDAGLILTSVRPTSFSSNFMAYDYTGLKQGTSFTSPLGTQASVNWVTVNDIGSVVAAALLDRSLDGKVLDVTGPAASTLSAGAMAALLTARLGREIAYNEVPPPLPGSDMGDLWAFLRSGGFDVCTDVVKRVTGHDATDFATFLAGLDFQ